MDDLFKLAVNDVEPAKMSTMDVLVEREYTVQEAFGFNSQIKLKGFEPGHPLVPVATPGYVWDKKLVKDAIEWLSEDNPDPIWISGPTGCLHGDTLIYDPCDKTKISVRDRYKKAIPFHVISKSDNGIVITLATAPIKYSPAQLYTVKTNIGTFSVTGLHKVLLVDGTYVTIEQLIHDGYDLVHLQSISEHDLSIHVQGVLSLSNTKKDSQSDYPICHYSNDEQLLFLEENGQDVAPSTICVHEHNHHNLHQDVQAYESTHNHSCQSFCRPSMIHYGKADCLVLGASGNQLCECFAESFCKECRTLSKDQQSKPHQCTSLQDHNQIEMQSFSSQPLLTPFEIYMSLTSRAIILSIEEDCNDFYYDFHVPIYKNYWAEGIFHHNSGKTDFPRNIAAALNIPASIVSAKASTEPDDLIGKTELRNGNTVFVPGELLTSYSRGYMIIFDEVDGYPPEVMMACHRLLERGIITLDNGHIIHPASKNLMIATANTRGDGQGNDVYTATNIFNLATLNRFEKWEMGYPEPDIEIRILKNEFGTALEDSIIVAMVKTAGDIRTAYNQGSCPGPISIRDLIRWCRKLIAAWSRKDVVAIYHAFDKAFGNGVCVEVRSMLHTLVQTNFNVPAPVITR